MAVAMMSTEVNDVQSQLNSTRVNRIVDVTSLETIQATLLEARREGRAISVAGGRHAMGGQQFGGDTILLNTKPFNRVISFDKAEGHIKVQAGIEWPELIDYLVREQTGQANQWGIREKQTGVDRVSLGGSLASNVHGRGLRFPPIISDVESFVLVDAQGEAHTCSRHENQELFSLGIGGYGLFGIIGEVTLRLVPRTKVERVVEIVAIKDLLPRVDERVQQGFVYGDCQYSTDLETEAHLHAGVFACYRPVDDGTPVVEDQRQLSDQDWIDLYKLARTNKKQAYETYSQYYLSTSGQVYWSDTHQLAGSFDAYREGVDATRGTEMITEAYVAKDSFVPFMAQVRQDFLDHNVDMTYGTIRFIEKDTESFLTWATEPSVCIVCNLHVVHTSNGRKKAAEDFRRIIDRAIQYGGRYYLTYHRWADRKQVETCYPQFLDFLRLKRKYDPQELFQSEWYRHYKSLFSLR
jgi:FAD/FMN-containing dehydrogenase